MTVAETIREITRQHLKDGGVALGQCLTAVGYVGKTVPELTEADGLIELSMDDTSGSGIAVGYALAGKRPIFIVRYQGFQWIDGSPLVNYAAKSLDMWKVPCPIFIRSIAMEGAIGPVAGSSHHGMFTRMPGINVIAPMTPKEYQAVWAHFMSSNKPFYISEHRRSFTVDYEIPNIVNEKADITLMPISATRLDTLQALKIIKSDGDDIVCNVVNIVTLKPFLVTGEFIRSIENSAYGGIVIDTDFENGVSKCIAHDIMEETGKRVRVMGLPERSAGFAPHLDNLPPTPQRIAERIREIVRERSA